MHKFPILALTFVAFTAGAAAQTCATLTITGSGAPGTDLVFALHGDASAPALLVVGETQGTTTISIGNLGSLELGLASPFIPLPLGLTDANGDVSRTVSVPASLPASADLFAQGLTITFTRSPLALSFCTSNVAGFHVGT